MGRRRFEHDGLWNYCRNARRSRDALQRRSRHRRLPSLRCPASPTSEQQSNYLQEQKALLARVVLTPTIQHNPSKQDFLLLLGWISVG